MTPFWKRVRHRIEWFFVRLLKVQMPGGVFRQWLF